MSAFSDFIRSRATGDLLSWADQVLAAEECGISVASVEAEALDNGILPVRYQRNRQILSCEDQRVLFGSRVAVIGCGGLGGYVLEELARLGVGELVAVDPDIFEEHNLNRQILSTTAALGCQKAEVAAGRIAQINPAVTVVSAPEPFSAENGTRLLKGSRVVVDCLDSISVRLELARQCSALGIPLVHGAIAGWYGQVTTQYPGEDTLGLIYRSQAYPLASKGIEKELGNPSFTPAVVASLQVSEVCKILLGRGETLRGRTLNIDLLDMEFCEIGF